MEEIGKFFQKLFKNLPLVFGLGILFMDLVALLAPILAHLGLSGVSHWIYVFYGFLCHQRPWRSIHFFDYQVAWCTRDTFVYLSMGLSALFVTKFKIKGFKWYWGILSAVPFAFDGLIQLIAEISGIMNDQETFFYASTNFLRMLTGSIFGTGVGLWLFSILNQTIIEEFNEGKKLDVLFNYSFFLLLNLLRFCPDLEYYFR